MLVVMLFSQGHHIWDQDGDLDPQLKTPIPDKDIPDRDLQGAKPRP